jgi:hypothetical protein
MDDVDLIYVRHLRLLVVVFIVRGKGRCFILAVSLLLILYHVILVLNQQSTAPSSLLRRPIQVSCSSLNNDTTTDMTSCLKHTTTTSTPQNATTEKNATSVSNNATTEKENISITISRMD